MNSQHTKAFSTCRSCYSHIAGSLATDFLDYLFSHDYVTYCSKEQFSNSHEKLPLRITSKGFLFFKKMGINVSSTTTATACLDGTEKRPHLAGDLGKELFLFLLEKKWVSKQSSRVLTFTKNAENLMRNGII